MCYYGIMSSCRGGGRFGNKVIRALAMTQFAEKFDLQMNYQDKEQIEKLGVELFVGKQKYDSCRRLNYKNFSDYFAKKTIDFNVTTQGAYLQIKQISDSTHSYIMSDKIMSRIIKHNHHAGRYNNNNDCFVHLRLGDKAAANPGFKYYDSIISKLKFDNLYVASDSLNHDIIQQLKIKYPDLKIYNSAELTDIMLFGSTCKYVVLSYGTFSAIIGYLAFFSVVYCLHFCEKNSFDWGSPCKPDMFTDKYSKVSKWIEGNKTL